MISSASGSVLLLQNQTDQYQLSLITFPQCCHHHHTMGVFNELRLSLRRNGMAGKTSSSGSSIKSGPDNSNAVVHSKRKDTNSCNLCGKRLLKLAGWSNYFTLPCRCRHMFCKQCITGRLECRQKVLRSASFDRMWTFPCPGNAQCGQQITVDFSRGSKYSKNLVAHDLGSDNDDSYFDDSWEQDVDDEDMDVESDNVQDESDTSVGGQDKSCLREIG